MLLQANLRSTISISFLKMNTMRVTANSYSKQSGEDMTYSLYIDDERIPATNRDWVIVRSVQAAKSYIAAYGFPTYISFDHDLGDNVPTGFDFTKWLVEQDMDHGTMPIDFDFNVHSANPVGAANIRGYINHYLAVKSRYAESANDK